MSSVTAWLASGACSLLLNSMLARECPSLSLPTLPTLSTIFLRLYLCVPYSWSDRAPMSPKKTLNVDLSDLLRCTEFFHRFLK